MKTHLANHHQDRYFQASFKEIKTSLDPAFSYLIFKSALKDENDINFDDIENRIECFRNGVVEEKIFYDEAAEENFLVIKLNSDVRDGCIQEFSMLNLPKGVTIYIFSNSQQSEI